MKNKIKFSLLSILILAIGYNVYTSQEKTKLSDLAIENIEALAQGEGPSMLGCKPYDDATCYVFDGNGQLVDKRKNQYPGK